MNLGLRGVCVSDIIIIHTFQFDTFVSSKILKYFSPQPPCNKSSFWGHQHDGPAHLQTEVTSKHAMSVTLWVQCNKAEVILEHTGNVKNTRSNQLAGWRLMILCKVWARQGKGGGSGSGEGGSYSSLRPEMKPVIWAGIPRRMEFLKAWLSSTCPECPSITVTNKPSSAWYVFCPFTWQRNSEPIKTTHLKCTANKQRVGGAVFPQV